MADVPTVYFRNNRTGEIHTGIRRPSGEVAFTEKCNTDSIKDGEVITFESALRSLEHAGASWCEHCKA